VVAHLGRVTQIFAAGLVVAAATGALATSAWAAPNLAGSSFAALPGLNYNQPPYFNVPDTYSPGLRLSYVSTGLRMVYTQDPSPNPDWLYAALFIVAAPGAPGCVSYTKRSDIPVTGGFGDYTGGWWTDAYQPTDFAAASYYPSLALQDSIAFDVAIPPADTSVTYRACLYAWVQTPLSDGMPDPTLETGYSKLLDQTTFAVHGWDSSTPQCPLPPVPCSAPPPAGSVGGGGRGASGSGSGSANSTQPTTSARRLTRAQARSRVKTWLRRYASWRKGNHRRVVVLRRLNARALRMRATWGYRGRSHRLLLTARRQGQTILVRRNSV
jgi:hypothetical protein